jgi:hypothetical protein
MLKKISMLLLILSVCVGAVYGLGLSNVNFGEVEQGETYIHTIVLVNSPQDFDNHYVIEVDGDMKDWITVSPIEFDLPKASNQPLTVTLTVPPDAPLGEVRATITAIGKKTAPAAGETTEGAGVGYAVATKSNVLANVVKPGATAAIEITRVEIPKNIRLGDDVKFTITAKNIGNVPATAHFSVAISNSEQVITTIPSVPTEFELNAEKIIRLYWDTAGQSEGVYTALVSVTPSSGGKDVRIKNASYPAITIELGGGKELQSVFIAIGVILVALVVVLALVVRKRRKGV